MQKTPAGLKAPGKRLWRDIVSPLNGPGSDPSDPFELTARELAWLTTACKLQDRLTEVSDILDADGLMSVGYKGQPVPHPLLTQQVSLASGIAALLARLELPEDQDDEPAGRSTTVTIAQNRAVKARHAAQKRWNPHG